MEHKIKTFEDACVALNLNPNHLPDVSAIPERMRKRTIADYKLCVIAEALNEGWQPDWSNYSEYKYFPYFDVEASKETPSGSGLSFHGCDYSGSRTVVGSRLCFRTRELAVYAGKQFIEIYTDHQLM